MTPAPSDVEKLLEAIRVSVSSVYWRLTGTPQLIMTFQFDTPCHVLDVVDRDALRSPDGNYFLSHGPKNGGGPLPTTFAAALQSFHMVKHLPFGRQLRFRQGSRVTNNEMLALRSRDLWHDTYCATYPPILLAHHLWQSPTTHNAHYRT